MMDDDEVEKFEITDYDLENEFGFRPRKRLTKEQQIYGIWADSDGEETYVDDNARNIPPKSFRGGVSFVAGGIQQAGKSDEKEAKDDSNSDDDKGFAANRGSSEEEGDPLERFPSFKKNSSSNKHSRTAKKLRKVEVGLDETAGLRRFGVANSSKLIGSGIGDWERHTTGIGSKLLKMMGYEEGKGLGKNLQGISTPVQATKRKGKGALGFYGTEKALHLPESETVDSDDDKKDKFKETLKQWKKSGISKKLKYIYKSAEEVIQEGKTRKITSDVDPHITKTKVIDMTGPEARVLSSYHAIGGQRTIMDEYEEIRSKKYEHFDLPELLHNLTILLEKSEDDIIRNARTMERENDRIVNLNHEREKYELLLEREEKELRSIDDALNIIEALDSRHKNNSLTVKDASLMFHELKDSHSKVFYAYEIAYLAPTYIIPLLKDLLSTWNPLSQPKQHIDLFRTWQNLVESESANKLAQQTPVDQPMDPYHQILWETWALAVKSSVMGPWDPKDCVPLLLVFESWVSPLVPPWIISHLLNNVVLHRITRAVHDWNPMQDTIPIHTWLHPWLPMLSDQLQVVYPVIRQKLSSALVHWHPSDRSAKMVLKPWKGVFSEISLANLIQSSIQPKIELSLHEMQITPHNQNLDPFNWFSDWEDMIPPQVLLDILERCFFPKWFQSLGAWLSTNPPYPDVISWYKGWRDLLPTSILHHQQLKQKFQQALEVCRRALNFQPGAPEQFSLLLSGLDKLGEPPPPPPPGSPPKPRSRDWEGIIGSIRTDASITMRDIVERRCQEAGILFIPQSDHKFDGRPVYRCGSLNISFSKNIIYFHTERGWVPKSLSSLLEEAVL